MHPIRRMMGAGVVAGMILTGAQGAAANSPEVYTWSNDVDVPYIDCGSFDAHGLWTVSHVLTYFLDSDGTRIRDRERVEFSGAFVNPETGASIRDSGLILWFDTLAPDGSYLSTANNVVRKSAYLKVAGRAGSDGTFHGVDRFDLNTSAACAALGG